MTFTALAMPVLIGGAGLAVDVSQWYLWKQELQFAVDQAALAGAWARNDGTTESSYITRATQEFGENVSVTDGYATPTVALVDWDGGTRNAVEVSATISRALPFTSLFVSDGIELTASAWATFEGGDGTVYTACIIALSESSSPAIDFHGGPSIDSNCGLAALSTAGDAISISGAAGSYNVGNVLSAGGVSDQHDGFANSTVITDLRGLSDPYDGLEPPMDSTPRQLSCGGSNGNGNGDGDATPSSYTITYSISWREESSYYRGRNKSQMTLQSTTTTGSGTSTATETASTGKAVGSSDTRTHNDTGTEAQHGSGNDKYWDRTDVSRTEVWTVTGSTSDNPTVTPTPASATALQPGTYSDFTVDCDTTLSPGVYVIDGGMLDVNAQDSLVGRGVMFVLTNGAGIKINGGANIDLTGMSETELIAAGASAEDAEVMAGMLVFEDRSSSGNSQNRINGNAGLNLSGVIYLPQSPIALLGTASAVSRCLSIAALTVEIGGNASLTNMCPSGMDPDPVVHESRDQVRLVR